MLLVTRTKDNTDSPLQENEDLGRLLNFKHRLGFASHDDITKLGNMESSRSSGTIASTEAVATATRKPSVVFALAQTTQQGEAELPPATRTRSLTSPSLPSEEQPTVPSVDRSLMTSKKRSRTLRLKGSHQPLTIDIHGANLGPSSVSVDANKVPNNIDTKPSPELTEQQQRTLRRRKHLNRPHDPTPDPNIDNNAPD
ncbi:hypothetical protein JR316_0006357 [Psilocybe cubensis]|uniref:Uncharacterized protein n=1 Tax=Psilocybe cubensis TaxID=181762 RepID=A0ACB8H2F8_PSICU|nr:hypothetical protein JR316_0006357 [Psilocybe cubensis]KAH9481827.1 hypothetical protein JR316_0006357 [Psilocybe cubensis]